MKLIPLQPPLYNYLKALPLSERRISDYNGFIKRAKTGYIKLAKKYKQSSTLDVTALGQYLLRMRFNKGITLSSLEEQINFEKIPKVIRKTILIAACGEKTSLVRSTIDSAIHALRESNELETSQIILLINEDIHASFQVKSLNRRLLQDMQKYTDLPLQVLSVSMQQCNVGKARDTALSVAALIALQKGNSISDQWIQLTDADCHFPQDYFTQQNQLINSHHELIAIAGNASFYVEDDYGEGINANNVKEILHGELIRNLNAVEEIIPTKREERPWIGMNIVAKLSALVALDGIPHFARQEDHALGAALEAIANETQNRVAYAKDDSLILKGLLRGSSRTPAGFADWEALKKLALESRVEGTIQRLQSLELVNAAAYKRISNAPTTRLLMSLINSEKQLKALNLI